MTGIKICRQKASRYRVGTARPRVFGERMGACRCHLPGISIDAGSPGAASSVDDRGSQQGRRTKQQALEASLSLCFLDVFGLAGIG